VIPATIGKVQAAAPMIHVPDVRATATWYESIGFTVLETYDDGADGLSFAILSAGTTRVMFNQGGRPSAERRREVDLYVDVDEVDELFASLKDRVDVVKAPHDTHYGMRELIIRDLNRFWITFGKDLRAG
jgi:Glyoxalase/Bleomycin resistance protein/Dioxygenase superfamily